MAFKMKRKGFPMKSPLEHTNIRHGGDQAMARYKEMHLKRHKMNPDNTHDENDVWDDESQHTTKSTDVIGRTQNLTPAMLRKLNALGDPYKGGSLADKQAYLAELAEKGYVPQN